MMLFRIMGVSLIFYQVSGYAVPKGQKDWSKGDTSWCIEGTPLAMGECLCTREGHDACVGSGCEHGHGLSFYKVSCDDCKCLPVAKIKRKNVKKNRKISEPQDKTKSDDVCTQENGTCGNKQDTATTVENKRSPPKQDKENRNPSRHNTMGKRYNIMNQPVEDIKPIDDIDFDEWSRRMQEEDNFLLTDNSNFIVYACTGIFAGLCIAVFILMNTSKLVTQLEHQKNRKTKTTTQLAQKKQNEQKIEKDVSQSMKKEADKVKLTQKVRRTVKKLD